VQCICSLPRKPPHRHSLLHSASGAPRKSKKGRAKSAVVVRHTASFLHIRPYRFDAKHSPIIPETIHSLVQSSPIFRPMWCLLLYSASIIHSIVPSFWGSPTPRTHAPLVCSLQQPHAWTAEACSLRSINLDPWILCMIRRQG
jgi:hypothetical protein